MVEHDTEEVISKQRVGEHKNILDMIDMLSKRLRKLEDVVPVTLLDTLEKQDKDVEDNRKDLYFVEDELKRHCKDAHISQGQVKKWIYEKIEEATNGKE
jgi:hypothetical protein